MRKGFTLIELLVVIAIIAVLSVVGVAVYTNVLPNARNATRKTDVNAVSAAWESKYNATTLLYPQLTGSMFASGSVPKDPGTGNPAYVLTGCTGTVCANEAQTGDAFKVCANLEATPAETFCKSSTRTGVAP